MNVKQKPFSIYYNNKRKKEEEKKMLELVAISLFIHLTVHDPASPYAYQARTPGAAGGLLFPFPCWTCNAVCTALAV